MGFLFKFLFFFVIIYLLLRAFTRWIASWGRRATGNYTQQQREQTQKEPETQEDRILDYQRKSFESAEAVDVEFEEVKDSDNK